MNVLILMAGDSSFISSDGNYPLSLCEVDGKTVLQHLLAECRNFPQANLTCVLREEDVKNHHLDQVIHLLNPQVSVLKVKKRTQGALCTALLAGQIDSEESLLILSGNELIKKNLQHIVEDFTVRKLDAGTVVFNSIHPRYSFVKLDANGLVQEAAEKNPISQWATAGFYWFKSGQDFMEAAKNSLRKDAHVNGAFYICPVFNELILQGKQVGSFYLDNHDYLPLKSEHQFQQAARSFLGAEL